ncbi:DedA family protein [Virgibacillus sp. 179-BFC.A HS]|uniref:DedA family protein n=1 Tax=Tigheibacillus jepli TaxID=3035914 RepID=A0ABU5CFV3_9BACI|nr:DedA family protein [Virgibacillus sp. 179-BFC.A HS]MDY0405189.1 DedA family protein [Virgibacillus sp. 179-BFC.A HS]
MQTWIMEIMEQFGYLGILFMMALENLFPPIPSEVILPFGGFMTSYTSLSLSGVIVTSTTGSLLGAIILYCIGRFLTVERLGQVLEDGGKWLPFKKEDLERGTTWFLRYGYWTVLFCRMIPLVRSVISVPAGMTKMNFTLFVSLTLIGTLLWNSLLVFIGAALGRSWTKIVVYVEMYATAVYFLLGLGAICFIFFIWVRHRKKKA